MPTSNDWSLIRGLLIMAAVAFFGNPWTWEMLLVAAIIFYLITLLGEWLTEKLK